MKRLFALLVIFLSACATQPPVLMWDVSSFNGNGGYFPLRRPDGTQTGAAGSYVQRFIEVKDKIASSAGFVGPITTGLLDQKDPNALSTVKDGKVIIAITLPMLQLVGGDIDALAQLVGHELAHQIRHHGEVRKDRESTRQGISSVLGLALSLAGVPGGGSLANVGTQAVSMSYSRDEEREADTLGFQYATSAGYDPNGAIRLYEMLNQAGSGPSLPFLSSHPSSPERIESMKRLVAAKR